MDAQVEDRQKRIQSLWGQMMTVLKQVCKQRDAAHFLAPVDVEKLKVCAEGIWWRMQPKQSVALASGPYTAVIFL